MAKQTVSEKTVQDAMAMAKATQTPGQTKEQTKLIAKGIEKGIAEYKKRQKEKARSVDKKRKKLDQKQQALEAQQNSQADRTEPTANNSNNALVTWGGYVLFVLSLIFIFVFCNNAHANESQTQVSTNKLVQTRTVSPQDLVYMMTDQGLIIIEVLPHVAPNHANRFKDLVREGFYDGLDFYRVIDGFVAQAGKGEKEWNGIEGGEMKYRFSKFDKPLKAEFTRLLSDEFELVQSPALLAQETGFIDSIPAGRDLTTKEEWFLHCPAMIAMARGNDANSGATEFYINIGQAPRHLDRYMSVFARVVFGMDVAQRMSRGDRVKGGIVEESKRAKILWAKLGEDQKSGKKVDKQYAKNVEVDLFSSTRFQQRLASAKDKQHEFYVYPGNGNVDVCYYQPNVSVNSL